MKRNALAWAAIVLSSAALVSSQGIMKPAPAALQISPEGQKQARALGDAFNAVAEYVKPSVVQISVARKADAGESRVMPFRMQPGPNGSPFEGGEAMPKEFEEMLRRHFRMSPDGHRVEPQQFGQGRERGTGSGFVYDDSGHIITNNHVVAGADEIVVKFHDGEEMAAEVVGTDPKSDVAVIKVKSSSYRPLGKGKSESARVGDWVLAIGSPFGYEQTVTSGIVSAVGRNDLGIVADDGYEDFIQTDAAINPGNSGGPLVDLDGRVIGINSAIATSSRTNSGVGFAIPIDMAANLADRIIKDGKVTRAMLGIRMQEMSSKEARNFGLKADRKGILVAEVVPGSPADKAGFKVGDVILDFNKVAARNVPAFRNMVSVSEIGKEYLMTYLRDGSEKSAKVTLVPVDSLMAKVGNRERSPKVRNEPKGEEVKVDGFGLEIQEMTEDLGKSFGYAGDTKGVVISDVKEGSPAEASGLEAGMLISKVVKDGKVSPVTSPKAFEEASRDAKDLSIYVQNAQGGRRFVTLSKAR